MTRHLVVDRTFDLEATLDGTQDFRWRPWRDDWHSGVLDGSLIHVRQIDGRLEYRASSDLDALLRRYFRLDDDIDAARADVSSRDGHVARLAEKHPYLRVLRQPDPWECVVAYICSATNNVSRISKIVEEIAVSLGSPVELDGEVRHTFPTSDMVHEAGVERLASLKLGLKRHDKIVDAAEAHTRRQARTAPARPAGGVLRGGETAADGLLRHRRQGSRLHRPVRARQDGGVPGRHVGLEGHGTILPVRRAARRRRAGDVGAGPLWQARRLRQPATIPRGLDQSMT